MRDNVWLKQKLDFIWDNYFSDIQRKNDIHIAFGRRARTRLGSIKLNNKSHAYRQTGKTENNKYRKIHSCNGTLITITGYFADERVPEAMVDVVIAHELAHYAHGFSSPLPQLARYPHHGGIVDKELKKRGLEEKLQFQKQWLKDSWKDVVGQTPKRRRTIRRRRARSIFELFCC